MHIVFVYYHCDKLINQHETDNQPCYGDYHILRQRPYHAEYAGVPCTGCLADFPGNRAYLVIDVGKHRAEVVKHPSLKHFLYEISDFVNDSAHEGLSLMRTVWKAVESPSAPQ